MQYLNKSSIVESWEFIKSMVILHKSVILWVRNISIILIILICLNALNITYMYLNWCEHHLWFTNQEQFVQKNIFLWLWVSHVVRIQRAEREALLISMGLYIEHFYWFSSSYFDIPKILSHLIHILIEKRAEKLKAFPCTYFNWNWTEVISHLPKTSSLITL